MRDCRLHDSEMDLPFDVYRQPEGAVESIEIKCCHYKAAWDDYQRTHMRKPKQCVGLQPT